MTKLTNYIKKSLIFKDRKVFSDSYIPKEIPFRENEISIIEDSILPALNNEKPLNIFIYGQTGTGKTLVTKYTLNKFSNKINFIYVNCKFASITKSIDSFVKQFSLILNKNFSDIYDILHYFKSLNKPTVLVFDEIDQLSKDLGDELLYTFTRADSNFGLNLGVIGISNNIFFVDKLDPRVRSSLSEVEILFKPYNALQLREILKQRAKEGLYPNSYEEGVISYIAAVTAREYGDARRAINLLRLAGEIAESKGKGKISLEDAKKAVELEEMDKVKAIIDSLPYQSKLILYALAKVREGTLGRMYDYYTKLAQEREINPLTFRRFIEIINDLEMLGLVSIDIILISGKKVRRVRTFINPKLITI